MALISRRVMLTGLAASSVVGPSVLRAQAAYPDRPIRLVVPFSPGGSSDFTGRLLGKRMSEVLGQSIFIDNKPGANGIIGCDFVSKAQPDGYTILIAPREMGVNPSISKSLPFDTLKDFSWIGLATQGPFVIVVNPEVPAKTFAELVALAKAQPEKLTYGSIGVGSISHLNVESLKQKLGIQILHVPYKGAGPSLTGALTGEISMTITAIPGALGFVKEGKLRALAIGSAERSPHMPDVPTLGELGIDRDIFAPTFFGLAAPANTPRAIIDRLNATLGAALNDAEVKDKLFAQGMIPVLSSPEVMGATIRKDIDDFTRLVAAIGLNPS